jgi:polysaccharide pyruvyl transferase WcaK-like protein
MNPIRKHTNNLFASKGCDFDSAMSQAQEIIESMPSDSRAAAYTALMVVVNTTANTFDQARGPSPEKLAVLDLIRNEIENWASSNFDSRVEDWVDNNLDIAEKIQDHMNDNVDIDNSISEWMNEYLESHVSEVINQIELVVKVR